MLRFNAAARTALAAIVFGFVATAALPPSDSAEAAATGDYLANATARQAPVAAFGFVDDAWIQRMLADARRRIPTRQPLPTATPRPVVVAPAPTATPRPAATPAPTQTGAFTAEQQYTLDLHNQARAARGVAPLTLDAGINLAATRNAQDMATKNYFAHVSPTGKQPWDWMREAGVQFSAAAQNIGKDGAGATSPNTAIKRLFNMMLAETPPNDGHRVNILNGTYRRIGVGTATSGNTLYWVVDFAN